MIWGRTVRIAFVIAMTVGSFTLFGDNASGQIVRVFTVNTTSDVVVANACATNAAGCSLRGAITAANPNGDAFIQFAIPASDPFCAAGVCTINISSSLPTILGTNTTIAGPGAANLIIKPSSVNSLPVLNIQIPSGTATISGVTIRDGQGAANQAGGITNSGGGVITIADSYLVNNGGGAGAVFVLGGTVNIVRSTLAGNKANLGSGGGVRVTSNCNIINSTIVANQAESDGGGVYSGGTTSITNSTIALNGAFPLLAPFGASAGGGVRAVGTVTVKNTLIGGNTSDQGPDVSGNFTSAGFNFVGKINTSTGFTAPTDLTGTIASPLDSRLDPGGLQNRGGSTPTLAPLANSPAIDKGTSLGLTGSLTTDQRSGAFHRVRDNPLIANAVGGDGTDIGSYERNTAATFDFDADVRTDISIFRPSDGNWWINRSSNGSTFAAQFGASTDRIVPADYTGDGKTDIAIWRPVSGTWFILRSEDFSFFSFAFGTNGDVPSPADFDNDGRADATVFRPSSATWFVQRSAIGSTLIQQFGASGDVPVANDYDGDGRADISIYRPSTGQWWLSRSLLGVIALSFGSSADKPVPGDFSGDGRADAAFWRPSTGEWFVLRSENFSFFSFPFGANGDVPAAGDFDGDGRVDAAVFRPSNATWFIQRSAGGTTIQQFGSNGDRPTPNAYIP